MSRGHRRYFTGADRNSAPIRLAFFQKHSPDLMGAAKFQNILIIKAVSVERPNPWRACHVGKATGMATSSRCTVAVQGTAVRRNLEGDDVYWRKYC